MIDSEYHRERLVTIVERWAKHTKANFMLRKGDIGVLVSSIMSEFYHVTLSCGHMVDSIDDGIIVTYQENDGDVTATFCNECAENYKKKYGAKEIGVE